MRTIILIIVGTSLLSACSSVSETQNVAANYADESQNPLDVLVENPIVGGVFYVLEATVNGAERGTNALLGLSE
jgi:hypothetical protein